MRRLTIPAVEHLVDDGENDDDADGGGGRDTVGEIRPSTLQTAAVRDTNAASQRSKTKTTRMRRRMRTKMNGEQAASARP